LKKYSKPPASGLSRLWWEFKRQKNLQVVMVPVVLWAIAIFYLPMLGNVIAFQDYEVYTGFTRSPWVGFKHFIAFFTNRFTPLLIRNTLAMSLLSLVFGTIAAIAFALLLNEIRRIGFKRVIQTISYLPYFVSMAVCANLFVQLLGRIGALNDMLMGAGMLREPFPFLEKPGLFWGILTLQGIWKNVGWNAIIYLAAISSIPDEIFEAAYIDGAGRARRMWSITLPSILPTIAVLLIMNSGYLIMGGFEQQLLMLNPLVLDVGEVLQTYVYKRGISGAQYSFAAAVGLFQSAVSILIILLVNRTSKRLADIALW
jgi:putative aldouronate transport system permease protein